MHDRRGKTVQTCFHMTPARVPTRLGRAGLEAVTARLARHDIAREP